MGAVLIADDDALVRMVLRHVLEDCGHSVQDAADGAELLAQLEARPYDLCIMDASMPGPELGHRLEVIRSTAPRMGLVVLSGYPRPPVEMGGAGVRFLRKPVDLPALRSAVDELADAPEER